MQTCIDGITFQDLVNDKIGKAEVVSREVCLVEQHVIQFLQWEIELLECCGLQFRERHLYVLKDVCSGDTQFLFVHFRGGLLAYTSEQGLGTGCQEMGNGEGARHKQLMSVKGSHKSANRRCVGEGGISKWE